MVWAIVQTSFLILWRMLHKYFLNFLGKPPTLGIIMGFLFVGIVFVLYLVILFSRERTEFSMIENNFDDVWNDLVGDDDYADDIVGDRVTVKY